jgi:hypothetical protein
MNSAKRSESASHQDDATSREGGRRHAPAREHAQEDTRSSSRPSAQVRVAERDSLYDDVPCTD